MIRKLIVTFLGLAALVLIATEWSAPAREMAATDFVQRTIYHSPQTPGYTSWCTLWRATNGHLRLAFLQITGPVEKPDQRTNATVILDSPDETATWNILRQVPPRKNLVASTNGIYAAAGDSGYCGHGLAALPDGSLVTGLWAGGGIDSGYIQRTTDEGQSWSAPLFFMDRSKYKTWPNVIRRLRDGRLMLMAGVCARGLGKETTSNILKALFQSEDGGRSWGAPIWLMPASVGVCEESDFAELDNGDLLFVHRTEHYEGEKNVSSDRWQSLVRRHGKEWEAGAPTRAPFPHSGFPELLKTREGVVLHVATDGVCWTGDAGAHWTRLSLPGSPYYPRAAQLTDGRILIVGHVGGDDTYGTVDQSVVQQVFRLKLTSSKDSNVSAPAQLPK